MSKKSQKKSKGLTQEEKRTLLKNFDLAETKKINLLVADLRKIRKVDKEGDIDQQITAIADQQLFYVGDFILREGWDKDRSKVLDLWKYLQRVFS
jgi:hypothetical protein